MKLHNAAKWPKSGTPRLGLEPQTLSGYSDPRRGRETSSPAQFGHRNAISAPHVMQNVHSKLQITASPASVSAVLQRSHTVRISNIRLALTLPKVINEPLVLIKEPTLAQLLVLNSVQQNSADPLWRISKVLHCNQCAKHVANEHILDRNQLPLGAN
jgi:hypothetical protein